MRNKGGNSRPKNLGVFPHHIVLLFQQILFRFIKSFKYRAAPNKIAECVCFLVQIRFFINNSLLVGLHFNSQFFPAINLRWANKALHRKTRPQVSQARKVYSWPFFR